MNCALWDARAASAAIRGSSPRLFDTYWAFLTFYCWVAYKERTWLARIGWLLGILLLGNIAMAAYMLIQLFRARSDARVEDILLRKA
jgi:hypothetical protein